MHPVRMADVWMAHLAELSMNTAPNPTAPLPVLPEPVQRYLDAVLQHGACGTRSARLGQEGEFLIRPPSLWRPFTATHLLTIAPAGFVWQARIRMLPGVTIHVRDAFVNGIGSVEAKLFDVFTLASVQGTPDVAIGSLQRYLAEAAWCPPALLPSNGVEWSPKDASSARATLTAAGFRVSLDFHFDADGLIQRVYSASRPRMVGRQVVATPWQGYFRDYAERDGMIIPLAGEVEWLLPDGPQPYWRGRITAATYERSADIHGK
jgi:hypothetical protein